MEFSSLVNRYYNILQERRVGDLFLRKTEYAPGNWCTPHVHENPRFVFVLRGKFVEKYTKKERFCQPFTCIFRPPLEEHSEVYEKGVACLSVDISPIWLGRLAEYSVKLDKSHNLRNKSVNNLINRISDELLVDDGVSSLAIDALLTEIAVETYRNTSNSTPHKQEKSPRWLNVTVEYIHEHFLLNPTLNELAVVSNVHPVHLARVFRETYQCTIAEYVRRLRIEAARRMLAGSDLTLAQIAVETGFTDQSHFTKVFKRLTNKTPADFRKSAA